MPSNLLKRNIVVGVLAGDAVQELHAQACMCMHGNVTPCMLYCCTIRGGWMHVAGGLSLEQQIGP